MGALLDAARAAMAFYDGLGRDLQPGEEKVLDDLADAIRSAEQALSPPPEPEAPEQPDQYGYTRADEDWFFGMDGKP